MTAEGRQGRFPADEPVETHGLDHAAALIVSLGRFDRLCAAPALRARQTASAIGAGAAVETALRECDYGRWQGRRIADLQDEDADGLMRWASDLSSAPHGGEPLSAVFDRVGGWMAEHLGDHGHCVVVTHATIVRAAVLHVLQAPAEAFWRIDVEPLSITEMTSDGRRWQLRLAKTAG